MFSNVYKNEMMKKFNLDKSIINSTKHYKIPKFVFKARNDINNQCQYHHPTNSLFKLQLQSHPDLLIDKSREDKLLRTNFSEKKKKNILKLLTKVQREKIDLLINKAYQQINNNIRQYNKSISLPKEKIKIKLKPIPLVTKEFIIDHVMGQVQKYLPNLNIIKDNENTGKNNEKLNKQFIWSHNFMEEKKMDDYRRRYRIKYIDTEYKIKSNKLKKEKLVKDKSIPEIMKMNTNMFFSYQKNKGSNLKRNINNNIYSRTNYIIHSNSNK